MKPPCLSEKSFGTNCLIFAVFARIAATGCKHRLLLSFSRIVSLQWHQIAAMNLYGCLSLCSDEMEDYLEKLLPRHSENSFHCLPVAFAGVAGCDWQRSIHQVRRSNLLMPVK